ncbi:MAG: hypothetical protein R6V85_15545 [Polyangia bacterium]
MRTGGGNYGGHLGLSAFTFRWRWFYLSALHISGGGGSPGGNDKFEMGYYGKAGVRAGVPLHLGKGGRHEIRGGLGVSGGIIQLEVYRTWWQEQKMWYCSSNGPFLDVELIYQFHILRRLAVLAGYEGTFVFNEANDNGYPQDCWQPQNLHVGFLGLAI